MIKTIHQIGEILEKDQEYAEYFTPWQLAFRKGTEAKVLVVNIEKGIIKKLTIEDYKSENAEKYLYREATGRATNLVPTFYFYLYGEKEEEKWEKEQVSNIKKLTTRIKSSFNNYSHDFLSKEQLDTLDKYFLIKSKELTSGTNYLMTFKIDGKYLGEIPENIDLFNEEAYTRFYKKAYGTATAENYPCAITGNKGKVYGFVDTLGFTVNDKSFVRNGFDPDDAYKMFPVSQPAIRTLEGGMSFVSERIVQSFYGTIKYLILPQFVGTMNQETKQEIVELFVNKQALNINYASDGKGLNGFITNTETILQEIIEEEILSSLVNYEMLFYSQNKGQLSLLLQINDVPASRLREILIKKQLTERFYKKITNRAAKGNKKGYQFRLSLYRIKDFFVTEQGRNKIPHPFFYRLVEAIFTKQTVRRELVLDFLLKDIRKKFKQRNENEWAFGGAVREGFIVLQFLQEINLFNHQNIYRMESTEDQIKLNVFDFIEQHPHFFVTEYQKGAFIFGALTTRLLYNQSGSAFLKELNNMLITKEVVNRKFPKLIDKLRKYKSYFPDMEAAASRYFAVNDNPSKDEISMAFTLGMVLQQDFDRKNKADRELDKSEK